VLSAPFEIENYIIESTPSIGISLYPSHEEDPNKLIIFADAAMYQAKNQGGNSYVLYYEGLHETYNERLMVESHLREALEKNEFKIVYQPQLDLHTKEIIGLEALLRWENEELGLVEPQKFIKIAENSGLLLSIGEWVLNTVCSQTKFLQDAKKNLKISVNISTMQFNHGLLEVLKKALDKHKYDPACLELQINESAVMDKTDMATKLLEDIKTLGVHVCLDDFGSEAISLTKLKDLNISCLSIDPNITKSIISDEVSASMVEAIIKIAHALKLTVTAVGIENDEQIELLKKFNADKMQGYFLSYPVPSELLGTLL
jgi:EAL domain-containing protein (putative c-di-GMP-specific phosphodiesterase class I)